MPNMLRVAIHMQMRMFKAFGLTLIPGYLFGILGALGIIGGIVLIILRAIDVLSTTTGNLFTIFIAAVISLLIAAVLVAITFVQFFRVGPSILGSGMEQMEQELNRPSTRMRPTAARRLR